MRTYYIPKNRFQDYQDAVRESQTNARWRYDLRVLEDRHQQNRLEDWNEFRAVYYRRLKACEKRVAPAHANLLVREKEFEDAKARLIDVITDTQVLHSRFSEIRASQKEVAKAKSRVESAEEALRAAKQSRSKRKAALMRMAHQEVASARDNLKQVSGTEEMRRLRDGISGTWPFLLDFGGGTRPGVALSTPTNLMPFGGTITNGNWQIEAGQQWLKFADKFGWSALGLVTRDWFIEENKLLANDRM
ncbi:hypothetical protein LTR98_011579 [Exophiala xenobiotica]|nr:hypothetical protein LTR98_011579 [Exophiala xenobiotica]